MCFYPCVCVGKDVVWKGWDGVACVCVCPSVELACHCSVCFTPPSLSSVGFLFSVALRVCSFIFSFPAVSQGDTRHVWYRLSVKKLSDAAIVFGSLKCSLLSFISDCISTCVTLE